MIQQPTLPVQQCPQNTSAVMPQAPEFNAIKINITGANVSAPAQTQTAMTQNETKDNSQQSINYLA